MIKNPAEKLQGPSISFSCTKKHETKIVHAYQMNDFLCERKEGKGRGETGGRTYGET